MGKGWSASLVLISGWALACGVAQQGDAGLDATIFDAGVDSADGVAPKPFPSCDIDLRTVRDCPECCICGGGVATRCDGTTFVPKSCHAACGMYSDWTCEDKNGTWWPRCPRDGGADATDATGD